MGGVALCSMGNLYNKTIWVKYDVEKKYVTMEDYTIEGQVGVGEFSVGAGVSVSKSYDWVKIKAQFTPIKADDFIELAVDCKDSKIMYVTIIADGGKIICNTLGQIDKNLIVTEDGTLRSAASGKNVMEVHKKYEKMKQPKSKEPVPAIAGTSKRAEERPTGKPRRNISLLLANKSGSIEIKAKGDKEDCYIWGMAVTDNGTIILADIYNSNIKSVSPDNKVLSVLPLPERPWAIIVLDTTTAVASADNHKLYIIDINDHKTLSLRSESQLGYEILAMVAYNGNLAVTCRTEPATTKLITIDGRVLWSVCIDTAGPNLPFHSFPCGITITSVTDTTAAVVVSDVMNNTVTLLEAQTGTFIISVDVGKGKKPYGITTDSDGNAYVCYCKPHEIGVWSADFQESKILLSRGDKLGKRPQSIVYSAVNDSLYVSYNENSRSRNTVDSFRLVKTLQELSASQNVC